MMERKEVTLVRRKVNPNSKNPLGLMRTIDGKTWQLTAYFHFNDKTEVYSKTKPKLSINRTLDWPSSKLEFTDEPKINYQLRHFFPRTWKKYRTESAGYGITLLFKRYDDILTLEEAKHVSYADHVQAVADYFSSHDKLPLLITDNVLFDVLNNRLTNGKLPTKKHTSIDFKQMSILLGIREPEKRFVLVEKEKEVFYNEFKQEEMQMIALLKGGFVDFNFNEKDYSLPLLPFLALTDLSNCFEHSYEIGLFTWMFDDTVELEKSIIEDIFIIGDIHPELKNNSDFIKSLKEKSLSLQTNQ